MDGVYANLTRVACNLGVSPVVGRTRACPAVLPAFTFGIGSALVDDADVDTAARVALLGCPAVIVVHTLRLRLNAVALATPAHHIAVRTHACNGPGWEGVLDNALLSGNARVAVPARVLAPLVDTCMLRGAVGVNPTLGLVRYFD